MNNKFTLIAKSIIIGLCLGPLCRYGFQPIALYPLTIILIEILTIYLVFFYKTKDENQIIEISKEIDVTKLSIGQTLVHRDLGPIKIEGIKPHCGDYAVIYEDKLKNHGWVYLKNCKLQ